MVEAETEAEAVNSQICLLEAEAEEVQKSTASASLIFKSQILSLQTVQSILYIYQISDSISFYSQLVDS